MEARRVIALLFAVFGGLAVILLVVGAFLGIRATESPRAVGAVGTVIAEDEQRLGLTATESRTGYAPIVEFAPPGGPPVQFSTHVYEDSPRYPVGSTVPVRYDRAYPQDADLDDFWSQYAAPFIVGGIGFLMMIVAIILGVVAVRTRRRVTLHA